MLINLTLSTAFCFAILFMTFLYMHWFQVSKMLSTKMKAQLQCREQLFKMRISGIWSICWPNQTMILCPRFRLLDVTFYYQWKKRRTSPRNLRHLITGPPPKRKSFFRRIVLCGSFIFTWDRFGCTTYYHISILSFTYCFSY